MLLSSSAFAGDLVNVAGASHIALNGYDPVAFFTDGEAGDRLPVHQGLVSGRGHTSSPPRTHKTISSRTPRSTRRSTAGSAPTASVAGRSPQVDISTWQVRDGKLYLNFSDEFLKKFNADFEANVANAEKTGQGSSRRTKNDQAGGAALSRMSASRNVVERFLSLVRRRQFDRLAEVLDDEFVMIAPDSLPYGGRYKGAAGYAGFSVPLNSDSDITSVFGSSGLMATTVGGRATFRASVNEALRMCGIRGV